MCGIGGIIDLSGINPDLLQKMSYILRHRGPDDEGYFISGIGFSENCKGDETISELSRLKHINLFRGYRHPVTLGLIHRRLSIIDLEETGHQPMKYQDGKLVILFNGEIYNYIELREELSTRGFRFHSTSDTEVILASFVAWGHSCVERFVGMWAFAIYDIDKQSIFLSRDRFGIKPLYYSFRNGRFAFASETKALILTGIIEPRADITAALEYIAFGANSDPYGNLFKGIKTIPPGTNVIFNIPEQKIDQYNYYDLGKQIKYRQNLNDSMNHFEHFRDLFSQSIKIHLRSDVPVGSCLSGGLDSGSIVAFSSVLSGYSPIKTFTASFPGLRIDERPLVEKLALKFRNISAFYCTPTIEQFWTDLDKISWYQDLPFNTTSIYSQWEVMKLAHENGSKVLLDGQGADETLGGYNPYAGVYLIQKLRKFKLQQFFREYYALRKNFTAQINGAISRAAFYYLPENLMLIFRNRQRAGSKMISQNYVNDLPGISVPQRGGVSFSDLSISSFKFGLSQLLRYEDRNSMAFSIESRVPFLDHRLVEYTIALDDDIKINNGWSKFILRKSAEPFLPEEITWRKNKLGFVTPQERWKKDDKKYLISYINDSVIPPVLNKDFIISMIDAKTDSAAKTSEFWKILSFIKWSEIYKIIY
jgi:asparagine synthase (glutamine-hydrolysing)